MTSIFTLPNWISFSRILMTPLIVWLFLDQAKVAAFWVFIAASVGDALDGYLARRLQALTPLGKVLDPLADKVLLITISILLGLKGLLPLWLVLLCIVRDGLIMGGVGVLHWLKKKHVFSPSLISKINTALQMTLIIWTFGDTAYAFPFAFVKQSLIYIVLFTTLFSWYDYIILFKKFMDQARDHTP